MCSRQAVCSAGAAQQIVQRRNLAEHLVAQESEFFARLTVRGFLHGCQTFAQQPSLGTALVEQGSQGEDAYSDDHENEYGDNC